VNKRLVAFLEAVVIAAILLVLVQTFLEDFSTLAGWRVGVRERILLAGFFFDLFFTVEFLVRLYYAIMDRRVGPYLGRGRGWIDFLAAVPLLMFHSGPYAAAFLFGGAAVGGIAGTLNLLKVIKAIRIARILRLLRIIKLFRRIKNVSSPMAQRHVAGVTTISVTIVVFALLFFSVASERLITPAAGDVREAAAERRGRMADHLVSLQGQPVLFVQALDSLEKTEPGLLVARYRGETLFSRFGKATYAERFAPGDYEYLRHGELELFFDQRPYVNQAALQSLLFFGIIVLLVVTYLLLYGPQFALTVTDPIHVMRRGLEEPGYNLEVRIPDRHREDDVFRLAELYNERYLPLKDRTIGGAPPPALELADLGDVRELLGGEDS
jgi:hypothetical protein